MSRDIHTEIASMVDARKYFAVATVVGNTGSVSAKTGAKALIDDQGKVLFGWIGGGCAQAETCQRALEAISKRETQLFDIDLDDEMLGVGMPCGGAMQVYVEPFIPSPKLWLIGQGKIVETLCILGATVGLEVVINDLNASFESYPNAHTIIDDDLDYTQLTPGPEDFVIIATQHKGDHLSMTTALQSGAKYIALIASEKRAKLVLEYLQEVSGKQLRDSHISTPAGIDIGAITPQEIALSVIAEVVMHRRSASGSLLQIDAQAYITPLLRAAHE